MYAFVHIEKTAGSTLLSILRRSFGLRHCDIRLPIQKRRGDDLDYRAGIDANDLTRVQRLYRELRGISGHHVKPYSNLELACPSIQYITILRDPLARYRSHFLNRAAGHTPRDFEHWASETRTHNWQTKMIAGEPSAEKAATLLSTRFGFVGLTERFDEGLLLLRHWLNESQFQPEYRPVNRLCDKRRRRDCNRAQCDMSYLDSADARAMMQQANQQDQQLYDFAISQIYPRQVARYAGLLANDLADFRRRNRHAGRLHESHLAAFIRNFVYKPLLHCRAF
jgi:hypothetical protein